MFYSKHHAAERWDLEFGFASSVFNFFVVFENMFRGVRKSCFKAPFKHHWRKWCLTQTPLFSFLVEFEALIWGESGDMRQHPLICIKFTRSALNENPHLHGSIFPQGQVLQPWPLQCQLKDEVDLLATKSKSYFSFYRNPPSFGSPNSFRINPIGFFRRPMPNILIFIRLFNQIVNWVCRISYPLSSWSQR